MNLNLAIARDGSIYAMNSQRKTLAINNYRKYIKFVSLIVLQGGIPGTAGTASAVPLFSSHKFSLSFMGYSALNPKFPGSNTLI